MRIVLMGDFLTYGDSAGKYKNSWAGRLEEYLENFYKSRFEVINSASKDETAADGFREIEGKVIKYTPDLVYIGYGTNDCTKIDGNYKNDFYSFESNIEDIAEAIRSQTNAAIVFNLAPPVIEELCCSDNIKIHNRDIEAYNKVVKRVCGSMMLSFVDHFHIMNGMEGFKDMVDSDGMHLNAEGHRVMFESIVEATGHMFR